MPVALYRPRLALLLLFLVFAATTSLMLLTAFSGFDAEKRSEGVTLADAVVLHTVGPDQPAALLSVHTASTTRVEQVPLGYIPDLAPLLPLSPPVARASTTPDPTALPASPQQAPAPLSFVPIPGDRSVVSTSTPGSGAAQLQEGHHVQLWVDASLNPTYPPQTRTATLASTLVIGVTTFSILFAFSALVYRRMDSLSHTPDFIPEDWVRETH